jgi:hypothetical protein
VTNKDKRRASAGNTFDRKKLTKLSNIFDFTRVAPGPVGELRG